MRKEQYMRRVLELAAAGSGKVSPNPLVGAVIVKEDRIIGEGFHEQYGGPHAEWNAVQNATEDIQGATVYVNLEPCAHQGKTPPCVDLLIKEKVGRVVIGTLDPNPLVSGRSVAKLQEQGIEVEVGLMEETCRRINESFFWFVTTRKPWVILKSAMTLDGKTAFPDGSPCPMTSETSREQVQRLRHDSDGIMVGIGTVLTDNPRLTCRLSGGISPHRIIVDSGLRIPLDARVLDKTGDARVYVATCLNPEEKKDKRALLNRRGIRILQVPACQERVDLNKLMVHLGEEGIASILLEGGSELNFSALRAGIVQKMQCYIVPRVLGGEQTKTPVGGDGFGKHETGIALRRRRVSSSGEDVLIEGYIEEVPVCSQES